MAKKKRRKQQRRTVRLTPAQYASRLAAAGLASLDLINQYEVRVRTDPNVDLQGATREQMLAGLAIFRAMVARELLDSSLAAVEV